MKTILTAFSMLIIVLFSYECYTQNEVTSTYDNTITPQDLEIILGDWTGTLTYMDYRSNKPYTMPANLTVEQGENENQFLLNNIYPKEPKANSQDVIMLSKSGKALNGKDIKTKQILSTGQVQITVEYKGKDNNKKALIRSIYLLSKNQFVIRKEVQFEDSDLWVKRNEYNYIR